MVKRRETKYVFGDQPFLGFENVTMVPYCRNLIDVNLLSSEEKKWIDSYHATVLETTKDFFKDDPLTLAWLTRETLPIE